MKHSFSGLKRSAVLLLVFLSPIAISGQNVSSSEISALNLQGPPGLAATIAGQVKFLKDSYAAKNTTPAELINGKEYESYYNRSKVKPLLFPERPRTSTAFTKTRTYDNLILQYDTFLDEVIYTDTSKMINSRFPQIALNKDVIEGFNLYFKGDTLKFRNLSGEECSGKNIREGFYEVAYEGKSRYLIRHESSFYEKEGLVNYEYSPVNFISTGIEYYPVKNKKSLLRLMGDKSKEVKRYLHSSGIRMNKASRDQIVTVLKFYDSLKG